MTVERKTPKTFNIILWIAQGLLALTFVWAGFMKIFKPEDLPFAWVKGNANLVLFTGVFDLLAGIGIMFPTLLRIKTKLTIFAAYGIIVLMIAASIFHISRGEAKDIGFNIFMLLIAIFVAWGRQKKAPITNK
ncbi:DoxX family protein [Parapedobacter sp. 2B3]|uniref:DoxX family protein n=1 Tax=Parapedobacter sp. 2B3 TaxID=3342381 RepID=UPI0035B5D44E